MASSVIPHLHISLVQLLALALALALAPNPSPSPSPSYPSSSIALALAYWSHDRHYREVCSFCRAIELHYCVPLLEGPSLPVL